MKIVHVIERLQKASGVTTFVENVVREQRALGHDVEIVTNANQGEKFHHFSFLILHSKFDVVHIHGLWSLLLHRVSQYARHRNIPVVWSTHGMTAPWSLHHKWWKKCLPWYLYQRPDLRRAALIHCTTDLEEGWNHALGFTNTFIAPLGTTLPVDAFVSNASPVAATASPVDATSSSRPQQEQPSALHLHLSPSPSSSRTLLYVGRIYPVKALDNLIRAFALAVRKKKVGGESRWTSERWILRIVGPDQAGHLAKLQSLCDQLGLSHASPVDAGSRPRPQKEQSSTVHLLSRPTFSLVEFPGPKYGADLDAEYENCTALALVSHTENFGATVIDALAHSKPVITSTNTPWKIVTERCCGYWVPNDPESLSRAISELFNLPTSQLSLMGLNGRKLVEERYTWPAIVRAIDEAYHSIL